MWTIIKYGALGVALVYGSLYAVDHIPSLKAQITEYVNPAIKEARLIEDLDGIQDELILELQKASLSLPDETRNAIETKIQNAKKITTEISSINKKATEASLPTLALEKISQTFLSQPSPVPTQLILNGQNLTNPTPPAPPQTPIPCTPQQ